MAAALTQGGFYFLTGIWPIISTGTFQKITGPKNDLWLMKTVGVLISVIGLALLLAGYRGEIVPSAILLAVGSAVVLTGVDVIYVTKRIIAPIYLLKIPLLNCCSLSCWLFVVAKFCKRIAK